MLDLFSSLDQHLGGLIDRHGSWIYLILFVVICAKSSVLLLPMVPGSALLFIAAVIAGNGDLDPLALSAVAVGASVVGNLASFWLGGRISSERMARLPRPLARALERTEAFYARYGGRTLLIAPFVPIVRGLAPLVAGMGEMSTARFTRFSLLGALAWTLSFVAAGFFLGHLPSLHDHFVVMLASGIALWLALAVLRRLRKRVAMRR